MSMRISSAALLFALPCAGCGDATQSPAKIAAAARERAGERVACAVRGSPAFEEVCTIERTVSDDGPVLTIRHPDGGFRRLRITRDGRGVVAADGAEPAAVAIVGDGAIEVAIGGDRYRLPATVRGQPAP